VLLGVGDDAALVDVGTANSVVCALASASIEDTDGPEIDAGLIAHDLVCAAFNRLAARGVAPAWLTLALCLPKSQAAWVEKFSQALFTAASPYGATLIGGDTTRGPLTATLVAHGTTTSSVKAKRPIPAAGDAIYVTGAIGRRLSARSGAAPGNQRLVQETIPPRVEAGLTASAHVSAAADIRLSLAATLNDLLDPFELGAELEAAALPVTDAAADLVGRKGGAKLLVETTADPELCFVITPDREQAFCRDMGMLSTPCTRIGAVSTNHGVQVREAQG